MAMTLYDFMMMDGEDQMATAMAHGDLVARVTEGAHLFVLYSVGTFYFELVYHYDPKDMGCAPMLLKKHVFSSGKRMERYLKKVRRG